LRREGVRIDKELHKTLSKEIVALATLIYQVGDELYDATSVLRSQMVKNAAHV
jgi:hypothetical protein